MDDLNNYNNENKEFKMKNSSKQSGIGKAIIIPFVSGVAGAALIIGICFGVPSIKNSLLNTNSSTVSNPKVTQSDSTTSSAINLANISETAESVSA